MRTNIEKGLPLAEYQKEYKRKRNLYSVNVEYKYKALLDNINKVKYDGTANYKKILEDLIDFENHKINN